MGEPTREELEQQVADLKAANAALLEGHSMMSIAYLAQRVSRLEEKASSDGGRIGQLETRMQAARDYLERMSKQRSPTAQATV